MSLKTPGITVGGENQTNLNLNGGLGFAVDRMEGTAVFQYDTVSSMAGIPIEFLAQKMEAFLVKEATLYGEARDQVEEMKQELMNMRAFLEDAEDPKATSSKSKQTQVSQVRDLVYDVEDIIDRFMYHRNKWRGDRTFVWYVKRTVGFPKYFWERRQIATGLRQLNGMIKAIPERYQRYPVDVQESASTSSSTKGGAVFNAESALFLNEEDLVGIDEPKEMLMGLLTNGDSKRTTISVVGMGGSGKTTLVANLFNSPAVKQNFDCCAWITVSQSFNIDELLRSLIREINKSETGERISITDLSAMSYRELLEKLVGYLEQRCYLVVLDDVWATDVWSQLKVSLPNGQKGSRVILTTRMDDIASHACSEVGSHVYHVKPLNKDKAWDLFCMRAFSSKSSKKCPPELQAIANEFVEKCEGLPLAIASVGGLLATKTCSIGAWTTVFKNLQWELNNNQMLQPIKSILLLSYNDLPYRLKYCFLYFALFPEDYKIWCDKLVRLWMAEGFVEGNENGVSPEEVGMEYIRELIGRNMFQAVSWDMFGNHGKCKMHDLYREIALTISKQEKFCSVYDFGNRQTLPKEGNESTHRRLSVQGAGSEQELTDLVEGTTSLRTFLLFAKKSTFPFSKLSFRRSRLARIVDMEDAPLEKLSEDNSALLNLKYLGLRNTKVKTLPKKFGKLFSLQTLDISNTDVEALPSDIVKLVSLRHLLAGHLSFGFLLKYNSLKGVRLPTGSDISSLENLQTLHLVEASGELMKQLRKMVQLVQLGITNLEGHAQMADLCSSLQGMPLLRWLVVMASNEDELLQMDSLNESATPPLQLLEYLILCGKLKSFPDWIRSLHSLTTIRLFWSRLPVEEDPVTHLQGMDNLRNVWFNNAYQGKELRFMSGFSNLRALALANLPTLEKLTIGEEGVMPGLRIILIRDCLNLKIISDGIKSLAKLEDLRLDNVPAQLVEHIRGPHRANFRHIPLISCKYYSSTGSYVTEKLVLLD
ncbi:Disease resistance protein RPM1 [Linum perenne]